MRPIDADAVIDCVDADIAKVKTVIEGKAPYYVGAQMMYIAREVKESIKGYLDKAPTIDYAPKQQWISVKDDLPAHVCMPCLIYADGCTNVADWSHDKYGDDWWFYVDGEYDPEVTHWMPLPEPPKEVSK